MINDPARLVPPTARVATVGLHFRPIAIEKVRSPLFPAKRSARRRAVAGFSGNHPADLRPSAALALGPERVDEGLADLLAAQLLADKDVLELARPHAAHDRRQIRENGKTDEMPVEAGADHLGGAIGEEEFGVKLVRRSRCAAFPILGIGGDQRRQLMRIGQTEEGDFDFVHDFRKIAVSSLPVKVLVSGCDGRSTA